VVVFAGEGLLQETLAHFRRCGRGRDECVVYWTGPLGDAKLADEVVHPLHTATRYEYVVDQRWAVRFAIEGARRRRVVRLQVHVHPGLAFHSPTDDQHSIYSKPGFLSLVVPDGAREPATLDRCYLAELQADGTWLGVPPREQIRLVR
jgi:hypothetical protein